MPYGSRMKAAMEAPSFNYKPKTRKSKTLLKYSCEEIEERMANGFCIFCEEQDTPGHHDLKHKGVKILMIQSDDQPIVTRSDENPMVEESLVVSEELVTEIVVKPDSLPESLQSFTSDLQAIDVAGQKEDQNKSDAEDIVSFSLGRKIEHMVGKQSQEADRVWEPGGLIEKPALWECLDKYLNPGEVLMLDSKPQGIFLRNTLESFILVDQCPRVWEPGGVVTEHDHWKGVEKGYNHGRWICCQQCLSSANWFCCKVAELTQEWQQPRTYPQEIQLRELCELNGGIETWQERCFYEFKFHAFLLSFLVMSNTMEFWEKKPDRETLQTGVALHSQEICVREKISQLCQSPKDQRVWEPATSDMRQMRHLHIQATELVSEFQDVPKLLVSASDFGSKIHKPPDPNEKLLDDEILLEKLCSTESYYKACLLLELVYMEFIGSKTHVMELLVAGQTVFHMRDKLGSEKKRKCGKLWHFKYKQRIRDKDMVDANHSNWIKNMMQEYLLNSSVWNLLTKQSPSYSFFEFLLQWKWYPPEQCDKALSNRSVMLWTWLKTVKFFAWLVIYFAKKLKDTCNSNKRQEACHLRAVVLKGEYDLHVRLKLEMSPDPLKNKSTQKENTTDVTEAWNCILKDSFQNLFSFKIEKDCHWKWPADKLTFGGEVGTFPFLYLAMVTKAVRKRVADRHCDDFEFNYVQPHPVQSHLPSVERSSDVVKAHGSVLVMKIFTCCCNVFCKALVQWIEHPPDQATWEFNIVSVEWMKHKTFKSCEEVDWRLEKNLISIFSCITSCQGIHL